MLEMGYHIDVRRASDSVRVVTKEIPVQAWNIEGAYWSAKEEAKRMSVFYGTTFYVELWDRIEEHRGEESTSLRINVYQNGRSRLSS